MAKIHLILQGKGGVGKSFIASILAQYQKSNDKNPLCIDTDPVNGTFSGYKALSVKKLNIIEKNKIKPRNFDMLVEWIEGAQDDVIIDNGASSFIPLSHYLVTQEVPEKIAAMNHELIIHTIVTGGQAMTDTINGLFEIIGQFPGETMFVVWLNPYWGPVEYEGKSFEQMKGYLAHKDRIAAIVEIPDLEVETFGQDLNEMLQERLTFEEALAIPSKNTMTRQRLTIIRRELFHNLDNAMVI